MNDLNYNRLGPPKPDHDKSVQGVVARFLTIPQEQAARDFIINEMMEAAQAAVGSVLIDNDWEYTTAMTAAYDEVASHMSQLHQGADDETGGVEPLSLADDPNYIKKDYDE